MNSFSDIYTVNKILFFLNKYIRYLSGYLPHQYLYAVFIKKIYSFKILNNSPQFFYDVSVRVTNFFIFFNKLRKQISYDPQVYGQCFVGFYKIPIVVLVAYLFELNQGWLIESFDYFNNFSPIKSL